MKKIIYIPPTYKIKKKNFINSAICIIHDLKTLIKNLFKNKYFSNSTSGYIEQSLHVNFKVFEIPYSYSIFFSKYINNNYEGIFINWKFTNLRSDLSLEDKLLTLCEKFKIKKVLIDTRDTQNTYNKNIQDNFDLIIQREKSKNEKNEKIISTILPCTAISYQRLKDDEIQWDKVGYQKPNNNFKYEIFFSGRDTNPDRSRIIEKIKSKGFNYAGNINNKKIPYKEYMNYIYNSSINLAIEGIGAFTFRHLEIIANCSFLLCSSKINNLELPIPFKDGKDFITYDGIEDLFEKIEYYLKNKEIRQEISLNARNTLEKYYSPKNHGKEILQKLYYN